MTKRKLTELDRLKSWSLLWRVGVAGFMGAAAGMQFTKNFALCSEPQGWKAFLLFAVGGVCAWMMPGTIALVIQGIKADFRSN